MLENELQTIIPSAHPNEKRGAQLFLRMTCGVLLLGLVLGVPSGILAWFDGLPWVGATEALVISVVIPFLLIIGWRFLTERFSLVFLCALLFIKAILYIGSPSSGWLIKVHPNLTQAELNKFYPFQIVEGDSWVRTYASLWNGEASGILNDGWTKKNDFPLDWVLMFPNKCGFSGVKCFEELNPIIEVEGIITVPEEKKFLLLAKGVNKGTLSAKNESGERVTVLPAETHLEAIEGGYQFLQSGRWHVSGKLNYKGEEWSLIPALIDSNGEVSSTLGRAVLWQNTDGSLGQASIYKVLSFVMDGGVIIFLLSWIVWAILILINKKVLNFPLILFSIALILIPIIMAPIFSRLLNMVGTLDLTTNSNLGFSVIMVGASFIIFLIFKRDYRSFKAEQIIPSTFILFGLALLFFFTKKWWSIFGQWQNWGAGDDWVSYQDFSRKIVVEGEWLNAGEGLMSMQPLYRYFVGIYHWLFGQSAFVQHMADAWCVLGATVIIVGLAVRFCLSPLFAYVAGIVYLAINLIGAFRYHIGKGLVENHAMIFMMLAAWFLYRAREGGTGRVILATFFGVLGYWTRQDHLGAIAGLVFLAFEPTNGPTGGWKEYWIRIKLNWQRLAIYWGGGILSLLALCFRNWWLGGAFFVTDSEHLNFSYYPKGNYYLILTGNEWPIFPSLAGIIITAGVFLALLTLAWRPKVLSNFPLSLGVIFIGLLAPYIFLWTGGYPPRFSIHILPLSILSLTIIADSFLQKLKVSW